MAFYENKQKDFDGKTRFMVYDFAAMYCPLYALLFIAQHELQLRASSFDGVAD